MGSPTSLAAERRTQARTSALLLFFVVSTVLGTTWWHQRGRWSAGVRSQVALSADQAALRLEDYVRDRLLAMAGLARSEDAVLSDAAFREHALILREEFGGFQAINLVAPSGVIQLVTPEAENRAALGRNVLEHPVAYLAFERAQADHQPHMTNALDLFQGGHGFAVYFPASGEEGVPTHYINGVFRIEPIVHDALRGRVLGGYQLELHDDAHAELLSTDHVLNDGRPSSTASIHLLDRTWTLRLSPRDALWSQMRAGRPDGVFLIALLLMGMVSWLLYLRQLRAIAEDEATQERRELEERLENATKMESLGRLAGGVAHDFNNILTVILGSAELLRPAVKGNSRAESGLEGIFDASTRASEMTRQLLSFARHTPSPPVRLDVNAHLEGLRRLLDRLTPERVTLTLNLADQPLVVLAAASHLSQVVVNLVVNAVDAMPEGGQIMIATERRGAALSLTIDDTGLGMDSATRQRIFEPFFTTKGDAGGTGLGLATVYGIVRGYGGSIAVHSEKGRGTSFLLTLPLAEEVPPEDAPLASFPADGPAAQALCAKRCHLLLAEDDDAIRRTLELGLSALGHHVDSAENGRVALATFEAATPAFDALITDVLMPEMDGEELLKSVRALSPDLPIVVYSGHTARARDLAADAYTLFVRKPCSAADLDDALQRLLATPPEPQEEANDQ